MSHQQVPRQSRSQAIAALDELLEALDRRVPQVQRVGEIQIARDAEVLRRQTVARIEALTGAGAAEQVSAAERADQTMTDDGGACDLTSGALDRRPVER